MLWVCFSRRCDYGCERCETFVYHLFNLINIQMQVLSIYAKSGSKMASTYVASITSEISNQLFQHMLRSHFRITYLPDESHTLSILHATKHLFSTDCPQYLELSQMALRSVIAWCFPIASPPCLHPSFGRLPESGTNSTRNSLLTRSRSQI